MALIHTDDLNWAEIDDGQMSVHRKQLADAAGGEKLGCSLYELPPGEQSWPYHYHTANEEAIYVLSGRGTLRLPGDTHPLTEGAYAALPAEKAGGHKVINDRDEPLRYLVFSGGRDERSIHGYYGVDDTVDYWADE